MAASGGGSIDWERGRRESSGVTEILYVEI